MQDYQQQFIQYALDCGVLKFGEFQLKSGRISPYFFNTGLFNTGAQLDKLGQFYAQALINSGHQVDVLYGPAYKGIPLVSTTSIAYSRIKADIPFAFNRKEAKDHGEGGIVVGAPLAGRVLIIDDVITDGAAKRESVALIHAHGAQPAGVVIMLDRRERTGADESLSTESAVQAFERATGTPVVSIADVNNLLGFLRSDSPYAASVRHQLPALEKYRNRYGA